jgi:2-polyprenyl-6-methoxyphenol hydroxylase-like FAD-dependent oxidoreductase
VTEADVLIAGAGPVGLILAIDLAQRGVQVELIERNDGPRSLPKMERSNARTMEILRRLGVADRVRAASRFTDVPMDVFVVTSLAAPPLVHLRYPSSMEAKARIRECTDGSLPLEAYQLISQYTLEPLLRSVLEDLPSARVRFSTELLSLTQDDAGVVAAVRTPSGTETVSCQYLVGCDGGASTVRRALGYKLEGEGQLRKVHQVFFRSEQLFDSIEMGKGRHYWAPNGSIVVQDDLRHFMLNVFSIPAGMAPADLVRDFIGLDVDINVLHVSEWQFNLLLADHYQRGRVLLAGDAVHLLIPTGGLGMNTGVGDAINLGWKLAGLVAGWGGTGLLDSYEIERRPIGRRNIDASKMAAQAALSWQTLKPDVDLRAGTPEAGEARRAVAAAAETGQRVMYEMNGIELGYQYAGSPAIWDEGPYVDPSPMAYVPTTLPGARLPHLFLSDGAPVHDLLGPGYTVLRLGGPDVDGTSLEAAVKATGAECRLLEIGDENACKVYGKRLILVRPDLHVAWRGDNAPDNPERIAAVAVGRATTG